MFHHHVDITLSIMRLILSAETHPEVEDARAGPGQALARRHHLPKQAGVHGQTGQGRAASSRQVPGQDTKANMAPRLWRVLGRNVACLYGIKAAAAVSWWSHPGGPGRCHWFRWFPPLTAFWLICQILLAEMGGQTLMEEQPEASAIFRSVAQTQII